MIGMPRQTLTCVLFLSLVKPSQCSLSSELKPKIYADGTTLMVHFSILDTFVHFYG
jgi:hypothetical protein